MTSKPTAEEVKEALRLADESYDHAHIFPQHYEVTVLAAQVRYLESRQVLMEAVVDAAKDANAGMVGEIYIGQTALVNALDALAALDQEAAK